MTCRYLLAKGSADDIIWEMVQRKQSVLNKAGLFSEDLSDAVHSDAPAPVNSFTRDRYLLRQLIIFHILSLKQDTNLLSQYFKVEPASIEKTAVNNNNNENEGKPSTSTAISWGEDLDDWDGFFDDCDDAIGVKPASTEKTAANNNNNESESKPSTSTAKSSDKENDLNRLLDDSDDEAFMAAVDC